MRTLLIYLTLLVTHSVVAQALFSKSFGKADAKPIIFLHGGPGYNCASFEGTTAQKLADNGYFVIVYDRRGEGRSKDKNAHYTFSETFADLDTIYKTYHIKKATLIGHSFGGIVATLYAEKFPDKVNCIFLAGAPVSLQETFRTIIATSKKIYESKNDSVNLNYMALLEKMDTASVEYYAYCFAHAAQNRFYSPKNPSQEMKQIYKNFGKDSLVRYSFQMSEEPPKGFLKNENYTSINLSKSLYRLNSKKINVYGIYGKEDGLYSAQQVEQLKNIIGPDHLKYLDNCSHSVFIDQQASFIAAVKEWVH